MDGIQDLLGKVKILAIRHPRELRPVIESCDNLISKLDSTNKTSILQKMGKIDICNSFLNYTYSGERGSEINPVGKERKQIYFQTQKSQ